LLSISTFFFIWKIELLYLNKYKYNTELTLWSHDITGLVWVTGITWITNAWCDMVNHLTICIQTTRSGTRILTFVLYTSFNRWAICINNALWSTTFIRISEITRQTTTRASIILFSTLCICSTRGWSTWVWIISYYNCVWNARLSIEYIY